MHISVFRKIAKEWLHCLFLVYIFSSIAPVLANQIRSEQELLELKESIGSLQNQLQKNRAAEGDLVNDLQKLEREITVLTEKHRQQLLNMESLKIRSMELNKTLYDLDAANIKAWQGFSKTVKSSFILGKENSIKLVLSQKDPTTIARGLSIYRYIVQYRKKQIEKIRARQSMIRSTTDKLKKQKLEMDSATEFLSKSKSSLLKAEKLRQEQLNLVQKKLSDDQTQVEIFKQREEELVLLLKNLQRQKSRVEETKNELESSGSEIAKSGAILANGGFERNKGQLNMPAKAKIENRFGDVKHDSGLTWEGLMFSVSEGHTVAAIYSGQVVFSDWFRGYGQLLVLDHGDGYMSLYGHNQLLHAELGSTVDAGELVASAGSTGGLAEPGLYFEIRHNGTPDDPLKWCKL